LNKREKRKPGCKASRLFNIPVYALYKALKRGIEFLENRPSLSLKTSTSNNKVAYLKVLTFLSVDQTGIF
jgi:hypothetical protein